MSPARHRNSGITLVELMVVMTILLLLTGGISKLMLSAYDSEAAVREQNLRQKQAQRCADTIVDSLRGAAAITSGDETSLSATFRNGDRISYYLADGQLLCDTTFGGVTRTGQVISDQVYSLTFNYYLARGGNWVETDTPTEARAVRLSVCLSDGKNRATESSAVKLRNEL